MTCCGCKRKLFGITAGLWFHSFTYSLTQSLTDCNCELFVLFRTKLPWRVWVNSWSSRPRTSSATPCWTSPWVETLTVGKQTHTHTQFMHGVTKLRKKAVSVDERWQEDESLPGLVPYICQIFILTDISLPANEVMFTNLLFICFTTIFRSLIVPRQSNEDLKDF